jgi:MoxR-like ATPase
MSGDDDVRKPNYDAAAEASFCEQIAVHFNTDIVTVKQINEFIKLKDLPFPHFLTNSPKAKVGWGKYRVVKVAKPVKTPVAEAVEEVMEAAMVASVTPINSRVATNITDSFVPMKDPCYVPFGFFTNLKKIIDSLIFYPVYVTGLSGNGKTLMVEQICAVSRREFVRVNITKETDETDLIGSYELVDGNTIRREGPVITAMRRGAILLLDETDYGSERLLCLQPILEGKPFFDKKTGELVHPKEGFNIIATANTKGKGSDDGRFIGANVLNEAFLERFAITVEQEYPSAAVEKKILSKNFEKYGVDDNDFVDKLVMWADVVRKTYNEGGVDEIISTRRLVHIARAMSIFKNRMTSIELCLNRFDEETKKSFLDLYSKIDDSTDADASRGNLPADPITATTPVAQANTPAAVPPTSTQSAWQAISASAQNFAHAAQNTAGNKGTTNVVSPQLLAYLTIQYGSSIKVEKDSITDSLHVISHGNITSITGNARQRLSGLTLESIVEEFVSINSNKQNGVYSKSYTPYP